MPAEQGQTASVNLLNAPVLNGVRLVPNLHQSLLDEKLLSQVKQPLQNSEEPLL